MAKTTQDIVCYYAINSEEFMKSDGLRGNPERSLMMEMSDRSITVCPSALILIISTWAPQRDAGDIYGTDLTINRAVCRRQNRRLKYD